MSMVTPVLSYIGLGSNMDDPERQLARACKALAALPQTRLLRCSSFYRSQPLVLPDADYEAMMTPQPDYINAVAALQTGLSPLRLLSLLQAQERAQGRVSAGLRWGPRPLDLDILLYGQEIIDEPQLSVPHPGLAEREFVLYPLYQIAPQLILPDGQRLKDRVLGCPLRGLQRVQVAAVENV